MCAAAKDLMKPPLNYARPAHLAPSRGIRGLVPLLVSLLGCVSGLLAMSITSKPPDPFAYIVLYFILWPGSLIIIFWGLLGLLASRASALNARANLLPPAVAAYAVFLLLLVSSVVFSLR